MANSAGPGAGGYETVETRADDLDSCYTGLGKLLNCSPLEIAVVSSATIAWQAIFYGIGLGLKPGDRILTSHVEYASNIIGILQVQSASTCACPVAVHVSCSQARSY